MRCVYGDAAEKRDTYKSLNHWAPSLSKSMNVTYLRLSGVVYKTKVYRLDIGLSDELALARWCFQVYWVWSFEALDLYRGSTVHN